MVRELVAPLNAIIIILIMKIKFGEEGMERTLWSKQ